MSVNNEMAIKLHEYYMNHKNMWLKIADILGTDADIFYKLVEVPRDCRVNWIKQQALNNMESKVDENSAFCFCCQAGNEFPLVDLCGEQCIVNWHCDDCTRDYSRFMVFVHNLMDARVSRYKKTKTINTWLNLLSNMAEEIANLPFRYQEDYDRAMKEGVNE